MGHDPDSDMGGYDAPYEPGESPAERQDEEARLFQAELRRKLIAGSAPYDQVGDDPRC